MAPKEKKSDRPKEEPKKPKIPRPKPSRFQTIAEAEPPEKVKKKSG